MESYEIWGGRPLAGEVKVSGAKNAVLPILAASVMVKGETVLERCPDLADVDHMCEILEHLGCRVSREGDCLRVDASGVRRCSIPDPMMKQLRSSVFLAGPLLARCHQAVLSSPGGCAIGQRPIDLHLHGLMKLGAVIRERHGRMFALAPKLTGSEVTLTYPSVGATENLMMAASLAHGATVIRNAAREPEIGDLQNFLNGCGAQISGAGTSEIRILGVKELRPTHYRIMGDRIEGGTYLMAAAITGGTVTVVGVEPSWIGEELRVLERMGCVLIRERRGDEPAITLRSPEVLLSPGEVTACPWPGFSTDLQSPLLALCTRAEGKTTVVDDVFENRFQCAEELRKLGTEIRVEGRKAVVFGSTEKRPTVKRTLVAGDLRGGAALVVAALGNPGCIIVENICHIARGYGKFDIVLNNIGACIGKRETYERETTGDSENNTEKEEEKEKALSAEIHHSGDPGGGNSLSVNVASV
ncbi:MAG: UDP-N-acetylglucosamine 1-carboxyvinyltransferase [Firmicutes bacterium]|nr:UDP-N-acetylglucosamine 1-carboxyvinyltransferase [Bacillota bacterium]